MNPAGERINGRPAAAFPGRMHWEAWSASVGTEIDRQYRHAMATRTFVHFEAHYAEPGVLDAWVEVDVVPTPGGGLGLFFRDVTARHQGEAGREEALAATEEARRAAEAERAAADLERRRLDAVLEALPVGVIVAEAPSGRLIYSNAAVGRIWGQQRATARTDEYRAEWTGYHVGSVATWPAAWAATSPPRARPGRARRSRSRSGG